MSHPVGLEALRQQASARVAELVIALGDSKKAEELLKAINALRDLDVEAVLAAEPRQQEPPTEPVGPPQMDRERMVVTCPACKAVLYNMKVKTRPTFFIDDEPLEATEPRPPTFCGNVSPEALGGKVRTCELLPHEGHQHSAARGLFSWTRPPAAAVDLRAPVEALVAKLDVILPIVDGYIGLQHVRSGGQYTGPNLIAELADVRAALAAPPGPPAAAVDLKAFVVQEILALVKS